MAALPPSQRRRSLFSRPGACSTKSYPNLIGTPPHLPCPGHAIPMPVHGKGHARYLLTLRLPCPPFHSLSLLTDLLIPLLRLTRCPFSPHNISLNPRISSPTRSEFPFRNPFSLVVLFSLHFALPLPPLPLAPRSTLRGPIPEFALKLVSLPTSIEAVCTPDDSSSSNAPPFCFQPSFVFLTHEAAACS